MNHDRTEPGYCDAGELNMKKTGAKKNNNDKKKKGITGKEMRILWCKRWARNKGEGKVRTGTSEAKEKYTHDENETKE